MRSPRYPKFSLATAIEFASKAYDEIGTSPVDAGTFYQALGYAGKTGTSATTLAALKYYNLVEGRGDTTKIGDLFLAIKHSLTDEERYRSLREALHSPKVFQSVLEEFSTLPNQELLESIAVRKYSFSSSGAKSFASSLLESVEFVELSKPKGFEERVLEADTDDIDKADDGQNEGLKSEGDAKDSSSNEMLQQPDKQNTLGGETVTFSLSGNLSAEVTFSEKVTSKQIGRLISYLQIFMDQRSEDETAE